MKISTFFLALLVLFAISSHAQSSVGVRSTNKVAAPLCKLTEAPKLRGFYLGQTVDEIQNEISGFRDAYEFQKKDRTTEFPLSDWREEVDPTISREIDLVYLDSSWAFGFDSDRKLLTSADYEDVHVIWWFMKERLFAYGIYYTDLEIDQDAVKFIRQVSAKTTLPPRGWKVHPSGLGADLLCDGFKVDLNPGYKNAPPI